MKTNILFGGLLAATLLTTACSDFLTEEPKGQLVPSTFFASQDALDAGVNALYEKVNQLQSWTNPCYPQWQGDDITANPGSNKQACAELDAFSASNNNKGVTAAWNLHYTVIKAANLLIENAGTAPVSEVELNTALGQAYYWRAFSYYYLVRIFGPLPLITTADPASPNHPLSSVEEVYNLIVDDLTKALAMPVEYSKAPRHHDGVDAYVTRHGVEATLAAVYMSMAGYPLNKEGYYAKAAAEAKKVVDGAGAYGYYVEPEWNQVYSMGHNYNKATVVGIDYSPINGSWDHDSQLTSCCRFEGLGDGGWGDAWGEIKFWQNYPEGPRKDAVYAPKVTFEANRTITKTVDWWELDEEGKKIVEAYHPMFCIFTTNCDENGKEIAAPYDYTKPNYQGMTNGHRHRVIRYAEVLLWYGESLARSGGDLGTARNCLRQVRQNAVDDVENFTYMDGTTVAIDNMSADQLAKACLEEHGWEVAGNWCAMVTRRSDEFRMNQLKDNFDYRVANLPVTIVPGITAKESVPVVKSTWEGDNSIYIPYPDTEVEKNPNLVRK